VLKTGAKHWYPTLIFSYLLAAVIQSSWIWLETTYFCTIRKVGS
jgi:hypothetical protein